jgi:hypothetical protein
MAFRNATLISKTKWPTYQGTILMIVNISNNPFLFLIYTLSHNSTLKIRFRFDLYKKMSKDLVDILLIDTNQRTSAFY